MPYYTALLINPCVPARALESVQDELNILGKERWELISVQNVRLEDGRLFTVAYLKRQKQWQSIQQYARKAAACLSSVRMQMLI